MQGRCSYHPPCIHQRGCPPVLAQPPHLITTQQRHPDLSPPNGAYTPGRLSINVSRTDGGTSSRSSVGVRGDAVTHTLVLPTPSASKYSPLALHWHRTLIHPFQDGCTCCPRKKLHGAPKIEPLQFPGVPGLAEQQQQQCLSICDWPCNQYLNQHLRSGSNGSKIFNVTTTC